MENNREIKVNIKSARFTAIVNLIFQFLVQTANECLYVH